MKPYYRDGDISLYLGDFRDVLPSLRKESVDLIFTDPPYGHNNNDGDLIHRRERALGITRKSMASRAIRNDGEEANELVKILANEARRLLKPGCCCCCCGGGGPDPQFARWSLLFDELLEFKQMIVWDKGPMGMGWHYRRSYETILVSNKPGAPCKWYDSTDRVENVLRSIPKVIPSSKDHPTPKPIELALFFMRLHSASGDLVLDPFSGGGSTLAAAKRSSRRAVGVELDERFCELAANKIRNTQRGLFENSLTKTQRRSSQKRRKNPLKV